jgi:hypothetical protein
VELLADRAGDPRPFAYLTISTTPVQLKKCKSRPTHWIPYISLHVLTGCYTPSLFTAPAHMGQATTVNNRYIQLTDLPPGLNIMSGSTWRGAHLRIAPAKPSFQARRLAELNPPVEIERKKVAARRRRIRKEMGEEVGKEAQDMRVVTPKSHASKKVRWAVSSHQPQRLVHVPHRFTVLGFLVDNIKSPCSKWPALYELPCCTSFHIGPTYRLIAAVLEPDRGRRSDPTHRDPTIPSPPSSSGRCQACGRAQPPLPR